MECIFLDLKIYCFVFYIFCFFPRATSEGFLLCTSSAGAGMFAPGRRGTIENGTPLSVLAFFCIKCIFYIMFSPFLPRRRAKAAATTTTQKWSFHNMFSPFSVLNHFMYLMYLIYFAPRRRKMPQDRSQRFCCFHHKMSILHDVFTTFASLPLPA